MRFTRFAVCTFCLSFAFLFALGSASLSADLATGKWNCVAQGLPDGEVRFVLDLKQSGNTLTGTLSVDGNVVEITDAKIEGNKLELSVSSPDTRYSCQAVIENNQLTGTWKDDQDHNGSWSGQRESGK